MDTEMFATRSDLMPGIERIESQKDLQYSKTGLFHQEEINFFYSIKTLSDFGYSYFGNHAKEAAFLVVERKYKINKEKIKQKKGGYLYHIGQGKNPYSIIFRPGGLYKDRYIVRGNFGTVSKSKESIKLYRFFKKEITKGFTKIKGLYVGPEAIKLANSGVRLITIHAAQPPKYDLVMN